MRTAAVDYGEKRVGVAISDELGMLARPLATVESASPRQREQQTAQHLKDSGAGLVLVGLPRNMDGSEGPSAAAAREFGEKLRELSGLPVRFVDERLTTVQASRSLREAGRDARKQKGVIDAASAVVMLQSWLDSQPGL